MSASRDPLRVQAETSFLLSADGRLLAVNDPERGPPPRLFLSVGAAGAFAFLRNDIDAATTARIRALAVREPPILTPDDLPLHADTYRAVLKLEKPLRSHQFAQIHQLPHHLAWRGPSVLRSDTPEGEMLARRIAQDGLPPWLCEIGIASLQAPWCAVMERGEVVSIAFAARLGAHGAEIGVATAPAFRGRRLAAAVTTAWSAMPGLRDRALFYSAHGDNIASQRVIALLDLPFLAASLSL